jgi:hypothetical protein
MFQTKVVEKTKTHILCSITFLRKSCPFGYTVEQYGTARQVTHYNVIWRTLFASWLNMATDTHSEYVTLIAFPRQPLLREGSSDLRYSYIA